MCEISNAHATVFYQYDGFGNITAHQGIRFTHDTADRLQELEYPSGARVGYAYDAAGRVSQVKMTVDGTVTILASILDYLPFGQMTAMRFGNGHVLTQDFDTAYRLVHQQIPSVLQLDYVDYDANGNLEQRDASAAGALVSDFYHYDSLGRIDTAAGAFGTSWSYGYDKNGNRTMGSEGQPISLAYEANSNRLDQLGSRDVILDVAGNTLAKGNWRYTYTMNQRLLAASQAGELIADYAYNGLGQRVAKNISTGTGRRFLYGPDGKLMVETDSRGTVLVEYVWLNGQVLAIYHPDTDNDGITNLQELEQGSAPEYPDDDSDGLFNIDELLVYGTSPGSADFDGDGVSDGDEVAQGTDPRDPDSVPPTYMPGDINADGQVDVADYLLLTRFVLGYMTPSARESQSADMNHDGVLDAGDMVLLSRAVLSLGWNSLMDYFIDQQLTDIFAKLITPAEAAVTNGKLYYVHNDHLGTPQVMTDQAGNVVWRAVYAPFGEATVDAASTVKLNLRFPGQYYDQETGLHYNYFRYYDPETGRYMRVDPGGVLLNFSDPQRQVAAKIGITIPASKEPGYLNHTYNYVDNNPTNRLDPTGEIDPVTAGVIIWSLLYFNHAGDAISDPNGNVWGEPDRQDNICTLGPILGPIGDACFPERCQRHDNCFAKNQCTASSWTSSMLGGTKPCNHCNSGFFK
jgi:RHS repeat-associated protein